MVGRLAGRAEHCRAYANTGQRGIEVNRCVLSCGLRRHDFGASGAAVAAGNRGKQHAGCWHADGFLRECASRGGICSAGNHVRRGWLLS